MAEFYSFLWLSNVLWCMCMCVCVCVCIKKNVCIYIYISHLLWPFVVGHLCCFRMIQLVFSVNCSTQAVFLMCSWGRMSVMFSYSAILSISFGESFFSGTEYGNSFYNVPLASLQVTLVFDPRISLRYYVQGLVWGLSKCCA